MTRIAQYAVLIALLLGTWRGALRAQTWSEKAPNPIPTHGCASAVVNNKIYVIAGAIGPNSGQISNTECYDPSTDSWDTSLAPIPIATRYVRAVSANNLIYVIGGGSGAGVGTSLSANQCYNPKTNTWTELASMPTARSGASIVCINNRIYVIGGYNNGSWVSTNECYDISSNAWSSLASMPIARGGMSAGVINNIIYLIGGSNSNNNGSTGGTFFNNESYNPANNIWNELSALPSSYTYCNNGACTLSNGIFIFSDDNNSPNFEYIPSTNTYKTTPPSLTYHIDGNGITESDDGKIYVMDGTNSGSGSINESYTISDDTEITKKTSSLFYNDTSITVDTSISSRDTIGINITTTKKITTTITYSQNYFTTTIDSIFSISGTKTLDTTFTTIDTIATPKQSTTNRSIVDTTILLPRLNIRDTVFAMDTLERTDDTVVQGKDTTIIITHSLVLLILKRDTLPDTAVAVVLRDTLVHSGDTTIHIIDTSVIPFVYRDTIIQSDSVTYTLRDTTIIGTDTIIRIHDTTVLARSSVSETPAIITSGQFSYLGDSFDFTSSVQTRELKIYDMLGRSLFSMQIMPGQISQKLPYLQSGAYIAALGNQVLKFIRTQ